MILPFYFNNTSVTRYREIKSSTSTRNGQKWHHPALLGRTDDQFESQSRRPDERRASVMKKMTMPRPVFFVFPFSRISQSLEGNIICSGIIQSSISLIFLHFGIDWFQIKNSDSILGAELHILDNAEASMGELRLGSSLTNCDSASRIIRIMRIDLNNVMRYSARKRENHLYRDFARARVTWHHPPQDQQSTRARTLVCRPRGIVARASERRKISPRASGSGSTVHALISIRFGHAD